MKVIDKFINSILINDNNCDIRNAKSPLVQLTECLDGMVFNNEALSHSFTKKFDVTGLSVDGLQAFFETDFYSYSYKAFNTLVEASQAASSKHICLIFDLYYTEATPGEDWDTYSAKKARISYTFNVPQHKVFVSVHSAEDTELSSNTTLFGTITFAYDGWYEPYEGE